MDVSNFYKVLSIQQRCNLSNCNQSQAEPTRMSGFKAMVGHEAVEGYRKRKSNMFLGSKGTRQSDGFTVLFH